jgi:ABC-type antimicrobial peptide transport system permease subunit
MSFLQFAWNNVRRNARAYLAYFLSSSFAVMIFFTYAIFIFHPDLEKSGLGEMVKIGMQAADYVIFLFSFLFVLYSVSSFLKVRKKEFGLLTILGTERGQLKRLIFLENTIIGFAAIVTGLGGGLLLAKLFLWTGAKVMEMEQLPFYLPWKAMGITLAAFLALFLFVSLLTPLFVRQNRVLALLQGTSKPKSEPKASILLALLSASSLIGAFSLLQQPFTENRMILILLLSIIGTYFLFTQLSVVVIRLLKKSRSFFWRGTNLLWVSEMAYKMKDNARMFFMVTIIITMASSAAGLVLSLNQRNQEIFRGNPFPFRYETSPGNSWQPGVAKIDQALSEAGVKYEKVKTEAISLNFFSDLGGDVGIVDAIRQSDYDRTADVLQLEKLRPLHSNEVMLMISEQIWEGRPSKEEQEALKNKLQQLSKLTDEEGTTFTVSKKHFQKWPIFGRSDFLLVVADATFNQLAQLKGGIELMTISYFIPAWSNASSLRSSSLEATLSKKLTEWDRTKPREIGGYFSSRANNYLLTKEATNAMGFIGVFMAAIFSIFTASLLYFKLYTDLDQDRHIYRGLSKIGLSVQEMKKAATIQIVLLFFIPLIVSAFEAIPLLLTLGKQISMGNMWMPALMGIGGFFVAQFVYFLVIRSRYVRQLQRAMV